jgi:TonB-dependent starch-binding outer membrane protein SusC
MYWPGLTGHQTNLSTLTFAQMKLLYLKQAFKLMPMLFVLLFAGNVWGQTVNVRGNVSDANGEALPGVTVIIKGTTTGTTTDLDGNYQLQVPNASQAILLFRYIGFAEQEIAVAGQNTINVTLLESLISLNEFVVIGYGSVQRRDITGSVASVSGEDIAAKPVSSVAEALTGKLAGVQVLTTEGSPDAEVRIRVRGGGSITGDNSPLFIVDGFPVESISDISPSDIESIDVLKDASSTAIYGSRGANGVIIITTKRGKEGKLVVRYDTYASFKEISNKLDVLNPYDYALFQYERSLLANQPEKYTDIFGNFQDMDLYREVQGNDWQQQVFGRYGSTFNHSLNVNGGTQKTTYSFSYNHNADKAIMQLSSFTRDNLTLSLNNKPNDKISLDFSMRYANTQIKGGGANEQQEYSSADSRLKFAMIYPPFPVAGLTDDGETDQDFNLYHPVTALYDNDRFQKRLAYNLNGSLSWDIIDNLRFKTEIGLEDYRYNNDRFYGTTTYYVKNRPSGDNQGLPAIIFGKTSRETLRNTNTLNYDFNNLMPENHKLNVLVGQEYIYRQQELQENTVHGFPASFDFQDATKLSAQATANSIDNYLFPDDILLSFFGRLNYDFKGRYLLSGTFRADGSSRFSEGNRWGYFPSAAFAWRVSDEKFMEFSKSWLDDLKLRISFGTAGNNNIPSGQMAQTLEVRTTTWVNGFNSYWAGTSTMANPDLKWETTVTRNLGIDYTTLNGRLTGSFEGYINNTNDLLMRFPTPGTGYADQYRNMGETENRGIEAMVSWVAIDKPNFGLNISGNIGFNRNTINSLGLMENFPAESGWASTEIGADYWIATGGSVGKMYGYRSNGRYEVSDFAGYINGVWVLNEGVVNSQPAIGTLRPGSLKLVWI